MVSQRALTIGLMAFGVVAVSALAKAMRRPSGPPSTGPGPIIVIPAAPPKTAQALPKGYTPYYPPWLEELIISQLEAIQADRGTTSCETLLKYDANLGKDVFAGFKEANDAALKVADKNYPSGVFPTKPESPPWQRFVWDKILGHAQLIICEFKPGT